VSAWFALVWVSNQDRSAGPACITTVLWLMFAAFSTFSLFAQHPEPSAAPVTCATCHLGVTTSYAHAPMRHALEAPGANPTLDAHPDLAVQIGRYSYRVQTRKGQSTYSVSDGKDSITIPLRWIFGQHSQTWVLEKDGHFYEGLVTYFPRDQVLATTPGDAGITPNTLTEAMGRELPFWETRNCFNCHATNAIAGEKLTLDKLTPGISCERCHEGSLQHMSDAALGNFTTNPRPLKRMNADEVSDFCGQCHRTWDLVVRNHWKGPAFVRFQPYRLGNSKCFIGNDPRISCLACHDPHQPANRNLGYYDSKCLACHAESKSSNIGAAIRNCPVAKTNCVSCHMPKVERDNDHQSFTDHQIRIVHPGDGYPN
jgi:hypothetical protein